MNKAEILTAIETGQKVTHRYFEEYEWVRKCPTNPSKYELEDGITCTPAEFWKYREGEQWEKDWDIWHEPTQNQPTTE